MGILSVIQNHNLLPYHHTSYLHILMLHTFISSYLLTYFHTCLHHTFIILLSSFHSSSSFFHHTSSYFHAFIPHHKNYLHEIFLASISYNLPYLKSISYHRTFSCLKSILYLIRYFSLTSIESSANISY